MPFSQLRRWRRRPASRHVGPSTTVITALPRKGDAIVEMDGKQYACWFRNLDPFPARIIVVHEDLCSCDHLDDVDKLPQIADLGVKFLPKDHKTVCSRLKRIVAKHGEFCLGPLRPSRTSARRRRHASRMTPTDGAKENAHV